MTTADFIIGHSADDADERQREMRKVAWALLIAVAIHLLIGCSLAAYGGYLYPSFNVAEEDKPVELSFVDLSTPKPSDRLPFIETSSSQESAVEPKQKDFESNANSIAASQVPPTGQADLPSQKGKDLPGLQFENQNYVPALEGAQPQPSAPEQSATPQASAQPTTSLTKEDELALLTSTPQPKTQQPSARKPRQEYQPLRRKVRVDGNVANPGETSVNATATALGRYTKYVWNIIDMQASNYFDSRGDNSAFGSVDIEFLIQPDGHVRDVNVTKNTSNQVFLNIMLQAVTDARLPAIPPEVLVTYPDGFVLECGFNLIPDDSVRVPR
jgi:outer membrane biosynthesis protein TonB